jgi:REP-associated tyrosine transposase
MPRVARVYAEGFPYHVTQRGNNKAAVFFDDDDRAFYLKIIRRYSLKWDLEIWAYCLMSNHVHLLVFPKDKNSLSKGIGCTNLLYTQYVNLKYGRTGRLWQNRFYSTIIETETYLLAVIRYIEQNPVRANLVETSEDYHWSSAKAHVLGIKDETLSGQTNLEKTIGDSYKEYVGSNEDLIENEIRKSTSSGRPLGSLEFGRKIEIIVGRSVLPKRPGRPKADR